jgi:acetyl-CoA carboxylase biotin carboxyl carrier protein
MAGNVWKVLVKVGDVVSAGQDVMILESMKVEVPITAEVGGRVVEIHTPENTFADELQTVVTLE